MPWAELEGRVLKGGMTVGGRRPWLRTALVGATTALALAGCGVRNPPGDGGAAKRAGAESALAPTEASPCTWCAPWTDPDRRALWSAQPVLAMKGGLKVFWNVLGPTGRAHERMAVEHGYERITLTIPFNDFGGDGRQAIRAHSRNPWLRPSFFESSVKRSIANERDTGTYANDIELEIASPDVAWTDPAAREASGARTFAEFRRAYLREWGNWHALVSRYTREVYPTTQVGIYGRQPVQKDYWGYVNSDPETFARGHAADDAEMWRMIDPHIDFYTADIYNFYDEPGSVLFMAANVEENFLRTRSYGGKPLYAYVWLRYHESNEELAQREIATPYLVEATAIVPFFSGAKGVVLWGAEGQPLLRDSQVPYDNFPVFMNALSRVAALSEDIGRAQLEIDESAHTLWRAERPLVRRLIVAQGHCIVMAINPWQGHNATSQANPLCGDRRYPIVMRGRATTIAVIRDGHVTLH
ncbi:MAG: hypothetical protein JNJ73_20285 [Hyphomonadaceae bacterium]|nr:hypothetical protein [Hyphomonadaceae bacterium]